MGSLTKGMIGKQDLEIQYNTNATETFERIASTGSTLELSKFPDIWGGTGKINVAEIVSDIIYGGTGSGDDLTLYSTSHATKGKIRIQDTLWLKGPSPYADIREYGAVCDGVTNNNAAILSAIGAGANKIFLPPNTRWIPTSNTVTGGIHYIGGDWTTVVIEAGDPATEYITANQGAILENVAIFDKGGVDIGLTPNVARPNRIIASNRITSNMPGCGGWPNQYLYLHTGDTGLDRPGIGVANFGGGDAYWAGVKAVSGGGAGFRVDVDEDNPANTGIGFYGLNYGAGYGMRLEAKAGATGNLARLIGDSGFNVPLIYTQDYTTTADTIQLALLAKTSGGVLNIYHSAAAMMTGNAITINLGNGGGGFGGLFLRFMAATVDKFTVNYLGEISVAGVKVIGERVVDARCDDVVDNTYGAEEAGVLDSLRDAMIAHGLIAAA